MPKSSPPKLPLLTGWGRIGVPARELRHEDLKGASQNAVLSRGLGRSYGDSALPPSGETEVLGTTLGDRILAFDSTTGRLRAEAGLSLYDLNRLFLSRGWFVPVTPGTQFVTMGGMVAADVHGKNHHVAGTIGRHVSELLLRTGAGKLVTASREKNANLFRATLGGMGLTGHILEVEIELEAIPSPWIWGESERVDDLEAFLEALATAGPSWPFTVGWIDALATGKTLGRGILMKGRWATPDEAPKMAPKPKKAISVPFDFPAAALQRATMRLFNSAYFRRHPKGQKRGIVHPESFFYPLDAIRHWNRIYGKRGFLQYQCVLPKGGTATGASSAGRSSVTDSCRRLLELFVERGGSSFLSVLKDCGAEGEGVLSFPLPGVSIALDLPNGPKAQGLVDELNELVIAEGGRIYLAKDLLTRRDHFAAMDPRLEEFERIRREWDPEARVRSRQSERLFDINPPNQGPSEESGE